MKALFACTPVAGHVNPLLRVARTLSAAGHETAFASTGPFRKRIEDARVRFIPYLPEANIDMANFDAVYPERKLLPVGPEQIRFDFERIIIDIIPAQFASIEAALRNYPADLIVTCATFGGTLPLLLGARKRRPAVAAMGITFLMSQRDDHAPLGLDLPPTDDPAVIEQYRQIERNFDASFSAPVRQRADSLLAKLGASPLPMRYNDAIVRLPDVYLQLAVPSLEYPRRHLPETIHFVGTMNEAGTGRRFPEAEAAKAQGKKIVLVTQGTLANYDLSHLIAPTLAALDGRDDVLVYATTGGPEVSGIPGKIPANARVHQFLPYNDLMPLVDVLVTNGGYGTVGHALSLGIPIVGAGKGEDKGETCARVEWTGAGVDLKTGHPDIEELKDALNAVLTNDSYRRNARRLQAEYERIDTAAQITSLLEVTVARHLTQNG